MSTKKLPPLVEVIMEIRWGTVTRIDSNTTHITSDEREKSLLAGEFKSLARKKFPYYATTNDGVPHDIAHVAKHQFWTGLDTWPCIQLGLGYMTVNHANTKNDYTWESFKKTCAEALRLLEESLQKKLSELPAIGIELRYQDAFKFEEGESESKFIKDRAQIEFEIPVEFTKSRLLEAKPESHHIVFHMPVITPKGVLISQLDRGNISGSEGFIQSTTVRSADGFKPEFTIESIEAWLEEAHEVQKHAFKTLILPTHERSI